MEFKLSICIPVYNRKELFSISLEIAAKQIHEHELNDKIEIVVSDNASTENIRDVVTRVQKKYNSVSIKYNINHINKGMAYNFLKVVELSKSEYCWIIGADDFIIDGSILRIIDILEKNQEIEFLSVSFSHIQLPKSSGKEMASYINNRKNWKTNKSPQNSFFTEKWDSLIEPKYKNVLLGSVMTGIFKKQLWDAVDKTSIEFTNEFTNFENTYPHCYVYSKCMVGKPAFYCGNPVILVGNGAREWSTETGSSYWNSSLPMIKLKIFDDIISAYEDCDLNRRQIKKCRSWSGIHVGLNILPYLVYDFFMKKNIKGSNSISTKQIFNLHRMNIYFYIAIILSVPYYAYSQIIDIGNKFRKVDNHGE